jgi:two-component system, OmpR family, phosphate regulon sensor histidine kinase PhoR
VSYTGRLVLGTVAVLLVTVTALVIGVERSIRRDLEADTRASLEREVALVRAALPADSTQWQATAKALSRDAGIRVTLIGADGRVRAESDAADADLPRIENHAGRPEVREALAGRSGTTKRLSATVGAELMYVAVPGGPGVIRVAVPLDRISASVRRSLGPVLLAALLALALGLGLAWWSGRQFTRPLVQVSEAARAIARGSPPHFPWSGMPDVDRLTADLREMHRQLTERFDDLRQRQNETAAIVEAMVEGVLSSDQKGRIVTANPAARRLLGYAPTDQLPDLPLLFRARDAREVVTGALQGAPVGEREIQIGDRVCLLNARALPTGGAVVVLHDLTRLRRLEAIRRDFVANVSHELKTPLTAISGYAETLLSDDVDREMTRRFVETILANARRMQRLVDDQLDLSRIESGHWSPHPEPFPLENACREAWSLVQPKGARAATFEVAIESGAEILRADPDGVRQVLRNLLENAIRHTPPEGTIRVGAIPDAGGTRVSVSDTGGGIPGEHLPRIFERFYRVDPSRSRDQGGTGLGLAIVKHLVEAHGGKVSAESDLGRGTTIHCWFPA